MGTWGRSTGYSSAGGCFLGLWQWLTIITHLLLLAGAHCDGQDVLLVESKKKPLMRIMMMTTDVAGYPPDGCEFNKAHIYSYISAQRPSWQQQQQQWVWEWGVGCEKERHPTIRPSLLMCNNYFQLLPIKCCIQSMFTCSRGDLIMRLLLQPWGDIRGRAVRGVMRRGWAGLGGNTGLGRCLRAM